MGTELTCNIVWTPLFDGGVREVVLLKLPGMGRLQITVHGSASGGSAKPAKSVESTKAALSKFKSRLSISKLKKPPTKPASNAHADAIAKRAKESQLKANSTAPVDISLKSSQTKSSQPALASRRKSTSVAKKAASSAPTSSSASASASSLASSSVYDEGWKEKQQHAFTEWLNYTFTPTEDEAHEEDMQLLITASKSEDEVESKEAQKNIDRAALRSLVIHRRNATAKKASTQLFIEDDFQKLIYTIDTEIKEERLAVRKDRDMYADLGLRSQIVSLLMSYRSEWLKLALETMFDGDTVVPDFVTKKAAAEAPAEAPVDDKKRVVAAARRQQISTGKNPLSRTQLALKRFVVDRVLGDPDIRAKYTKGKCRIPSGKFEKLYKDELRKVALHRVITLIALLDKSRNANILDKIPCLFNVNGEVKSTKELLTCIQRDFLSGEGNFMKHLHHMGLDVTYQQKFIDEYDFSVTNLAVDLRDGIRLCRMTEILVGDAQFSLSSKLRVPAVSRLQKLHNVGIALTGLANAGVAIGSLTAKDVVDGNRQGVLSLLWRTIVHFKLGELLNKEVLEQEIRDVRRASKRRMITGIGFKAVRSADDLNLKEAELTSLLLTWCQEVCATFGLPIENFTDSFADGKALCLLIHYYHPAILPRSEILSTTTDLKNSTRTLTEDDYKHAVMNEQKNGRLARRTMGDLGGIPSMLNDFDTTCVPEEKSMVGCVAYLCSRLIESSSEIQAALILQNAYRRWYGGQLYQQKFIEAKKIWDWYKTCKAKVAERNEIKFGKAVSKIENFVLKSKKRRKTIQDGKKLRAKWMKASTVICNAVRAWNARRTLEGLREELRASQEIASTIIQSGVRMMLAKIEAEGLRDDIRRCRNAAAITIQKLWRLQMAQIQMAMEDLAAIQIQAVARRMFGRGQFVARMKEVESAAEEMMKMEAFAAALIQSHVRGTIVRNELFFQNFAATEVQRTWRGHKDWTLFRDMIGAAIILQGLFRGRIARDTFERTLGAAILLQSWGRMLLGKKVFALKLEDKRETEQKELEMMAAVVIQSVGRMMMARKAFKAELNEKTEKEAAVVMQSVGRMMMARKVARKTSENKAFERNTNATTVIQAFFRGWMVRNELVFANFATTEIQRMWRGAKQQIDYIKMCLAALKVQSVWRMALKKREYAGMIQKAVIIESVARMFVAKRGLKKAITGATKIQGVVRGFVALNKFNEKLCAAMVVQSFGRVVIAKKTFKKASVAAKELQERKVDAAVGFQSAFRGYVAKKEFAKVKAVIKFQAVFRGFLDRQDVALAHFAAVQVQKMWRGSRQHVNFITMVLAAIKVQSCVRMDKQKVSFKIELMAIDIIQRWWRLQKIRDDKRRVAAAVKVQGAMRMLAKRREYADKVQKAVVVESAARMFVARRALKRAVVGATKIQSAVRGFVALNTFNANLCAAIVVQSTARKFVLRKKYLATLKKIVTVQSFGRMVAGMALRVRLSRSRMEVAATAIQRVARGRAARQDIALANFAATEIQRMYRGACCQVEYILKIFAVTKVQSAVRGFQAKQTVKLGHFAATIIQNVVRGFLAVKKVERTREDIWRGKVEDFRMGVAARKAQGAGRGMLRRMRVVRNVGVVSRFVRGFLAKLKARRTRKLIVDLQSMWRGRKAREKTCKRMRVIRMKIALANKKALEMPEMRLGVRTQMALEVLLNSKRLAEIMRATCTLEVSSRFSERCCEAFSAAGAPEILFKLIRTCNRSLPHIELLQYVLMTIGNVARWEHLVDSVGVEESVDVLVDLIQMFRDKDTIVVLCGELLIRLVRSVRNCRESAMEEGNAKRLEGLLKISMRKAGIVGKVKGGRGGKENRVGNRGGKTVKGGKGGKEGKDYGIYVLQTLMGELGLKIGA